MTQNDPFPLQTRIVSEVHQETELKPSSLEVVQYLGTVLIGEQFDSFKLYDDFIVTGDIGNVAVPKTLAPVIQVDFHLRIIGYALVPEFDFNTILIHWLHETVALVLVNIQTGPNDLIGFLPEKDFHWI